MFPIAILFYFEHFFYFV